MRSIRRTDRSLPAKLLAAAAVALALYGAFHVPGPPTAPRFEGAGAETPRSGGTLVTYVGDDIRTFDPHIAYDELSIAGVRLVYDGLLDYAPDGSFIPRLLRELPEVSANGTTFTFRLKRGVRFHDGSELTSEDVLYSMRRLLSPELGSPGVPFFTSIVGASAYNAGEAAEIEGIRVLDSHTLEFRLVEPDQTFLNAMAMTFAYPMKRSQVERYGNQVGRHPLGTGAFRFRSWERGVEVRFDRFAGHHERRPRADHIVLLENIDTTLAVARFQNGDVDVLHAMSSAHRRRFKRWPAWAPYQEEHPDVSIYGLTMNCEIPPFDDVHVRRAVAFALDRRSRIRLSDGRLRAAGQALPPQLAGYDPALPSLQRDDLEAARREMALAGHPDGIATPISVVVSEGEAGRSQIELLQQDLGRIGLRVEGQPMSFAQYLEESGKRRRVQAFFSGWSMDFPDPSNFLDILFHSRSIHETHSENRSFYRNDELDGLLDRARAEVDRERRIALYRQANEIVARDAPWAFLYYPQTMELWQPYVRGYEPHPIWARNFRDVWLDLPRRSAARRSVRAARLLHPLGVVRP